MTPIPERPTLMGPLVSTQVALEITPLFRDWFEPDEEAEFSELLGWILQSKTDAFEIAVKLEKHFFVDESLVIEMAKADISKVRRGVFNRMLAEWIREHAVQHTLPVGTCLLPPRRPTEAAAERFDLIKNEVTIVKIDLERALYVCSSGKTIPWEDTMGYQVLA